MDVLLRKRRWALFAALAILPASVLVGLNALQGHAQSSGANRGESPVEIVVFAPGPGDNAGIHGIGWFVDMEIDFPPDSLEATGFNGFQLTGPPPRQRPA